jgi:hypothetical protein
LIRGCGQRLSWFLRQFWILPLLESPWMTTYSTSCMFKLQFSNDVDVHLAVSFFLRRKLFSTNRALCALAEY